MPGWREPSKPLLGYRRAADVAAQPFELLAFIGHPALLRQMASERLIVFFDDPIEQGLLGPVTTGHSLPWAC